MKKFLDLAVTALTFLTNHLTRLRLYLFGSPDEEKREPIAFVFRHDLERPLKDKLKACLQDQLDVEDVSCIDEDAALESAFEARVFFDHFQEEETLVFYDEPSLNAYLHRQDSPEARRLWEQASVTELSSLELRRGRM